MTTDQPTPGPWRWVENTGLDDMGSIKGADGEEVCSFGEAESHGTPPSEADLALILRAPELQAEVERLRGLLARADLYVTRDGRGGGLASEIRAALGKGGTEQAVLDRDERIRELEAALDAEAEVWKARIAKLEDACELYKEAQSHHGTHWDPTMRHGAGCAECQRVRELHDKARAILDGKDAS